MKKNSLNEYYSNCSLKTLDIAYERTLTAELSHNAYALKMQVLNNIIDKKIPDRHEYAFLCNKYLGSKNTTGSAGSMLVA